MRTCPECGGGVARPATGRPKVYCSRRCQGRANYARQVAAGRPYRTYPTATPQAAVAKARHARRAAEKAAGLAHAPCPILTDREYTPEQVAFGRAMDRQKRRLGRQLTAADVLAVAVALGYRKVSLQPDGPLNAE